VLDGDIQQMATSLQQGDTIAVAPGVIDAFDLTVPFPQASPRYSSNVNAAWHPSAAAGGPVVAPSAFGNVLALRPFSMTVRPDGRRAIVAYYQTGNFGILDLDGQTHFPPPLPSPPPKNFTGVVAVTPAILLDRNLWPQIAADERLLFPTRVTYSQNGSFAAAVHTGVDPATNGPGGAVSFILDSGITSDLTANAASTSPFRGVDRPWYAQFPIEGAVTTMFDVQVGGQTLTFARPRDVVVGPTLRVEEPRFGDRISDRSNVSLIWNTPATALSYTVSDLGSPIQPGAPSQIASGSLQIASADRSIDKTLSTLAPGVPLTPEHLYRISFSLDGASGRLADVSVDVVLKN